MSLNVIKCHHLLIQGAVPYPEANVAGFRNNAVITALPPIAAAFNNQRCGKMMGFPGMTSCNLPAATTEPVKVKEPMAMPILRLSGVMTTMTVRMVMMVLIVIRKMLRKPLRIHQSSTKIMKTQHLPIANRLKICLSCFPPLCLSCLDKLRCFQCFHHTVTVDGIEITCETCKNGS